MSRAARRAASATPRAGRWAAAGALLGLLAGVLAFAPASWLARAVAGATGQQLLLQETRGTVWQGSARWVLAGGTGAADAQALPGRIAWSLAPAWDGAVLRLQMPCCATAPLELRLAGLWSGSRLQVSDTASRWPAAVLAGLGAPWNTVRPEGELRLSPQALSLEWVGGRWQLQGRLRVDAVGMASRLSTLRPLGSYRLQVEASQGGPSGDNAPRLRLQTLEGSLQMQGEGAWTGSGWRFRGEASAAAGNEAALSNLLNILGRRAGARSIISLG